MSPNNNSGLPINSNVISEAPCCFCFALDAAPRDLRRAHEPRGASGHVEEVAAFSPMPARPGVPGQGGTGERDAGRHFSRIEAGFGKAALSHPASPWAV
jgi:hypothetical protein